MAKKLLLPILFVAIFISILGYVVKRTQSDQANKTLIYQKKEITVGQTKVLAEIADSEEKRSQGLGGRETLRSDGGMLFIFPVKSVFPGFWMKGMKIPIDILWIKDGVVSQITENVQPPAKDTPDSKLKLHYPAKPVDTVLEVNANFTETYLVKVGDKVSN